MPITKRIQYRYDSVRNKVGMTDANGGVFTYIYDLDRRLTGLVNPLGERTTYVYDVASRRTSVELANGTRTNYVYDAGSRVQKVETLKSDDTPVSSFEYGYDLNGRRTSAVELDGSRVTWTYDRVSQVTSEWRTGTNAHRHTFTYDSVGNRTLKIEDGARTTLVYDACNQLVSSEAAGGTTSYVYDGNGNQTVAIAPSGARTTQVWDYENRLIKTIQPSLAVTSMAYDADGLRLKKEEPGKTTLFVWDDQNYLEETDAAGTTEKAYTTEPSTYGSLISHRAAGASTFYHFDALAATRALTDESESVLERYNYTAFGTLLGTPTLLTPFLWGGLVGYYWDADLATNYIRARFYQPTIARWLTLDPIGFAGGDANLFRYVGNSPTSGSSAMRITLTLFAFGPAQHVIELAVLRDMSIGNANERHRGGIQGGDPVLCSVGDSTHDSWYPDLAIDPKGTAPTYPGQYGRRGKQEILIACDLFDSWYRTQPDPSTWTKSLPGCPCELPTERCPTFPDPKVWTVPSDPNYWGNFHPGAELCIRTAASGSGEQCCYDSNKKLITSGSGAGSSDMASPSNGIMDNLLGYGHMARDVNPFHYAITCDQQRKTPGRSVKLYYDKRPANNKNNCPLNPTNW